MARTKTLREELLAHTAKDERHHEETQEALRDLRKCIDVLTTTVMDGFRQREELSVATRKATITDEIDAKKTRRALAKKAAMVVLAIAGAIAGAAVHGCI